VLNKLIDWSKGNFSELPWRLHRTLYNTLVSEIMLQQTTVTTVIPKFNEFIKRFPNIETLAKANEKEVLIYWQGLGYYRRARSLHKAAITIFENYNCEIPTDKDLLMSIPGIGEYTSSAILAIGFDKFQLAIDANLERIFSRVYEIKLCKGKDLKFLIQQKVNDKLFFPNIKKVSSREINEAFMDLGRTICRQNKVECEICPLKSICKSRNKKPLLLPLPSKKKSIKHNLELNRIIISEGDKIFVIKREKGLWLEDQWEIPTFFKSSSDQGFLKTNQYKSLSSVKLSKKIVKTFKSAITKYVIVNHVYNGNINIIEKEGLKGRFVNPNKTKLHLTSSTLKACY